MSFKIFLREQSQAFSSPTRLNPLPDLHRVVWRIASYGVALPTLIALTSFARLLPYV